MLPEHHLAKESKEIIHLGIGVIITLTALVLGLLIASAKGSFDTKSDEIRQSSIKIIQIDRQLRNFGPESQPARELLRRWVDNNAAAIFERPKAVEFRLASRGRRVDGVPGEGCARLRRRRHPARHPGEDP